MLLFGVQAFGLQHLGGLRFGDEALGLGWGGLGTRSMPTDLRASLEKSSRRLSGLFAILKRRHPEPYRDYIYIYIFIYV